MKFKKNDLKKIKLIIKSRRDVRGNNFLSKKISKKNINTIIKAGLDAPSVGYSQPWHFVIIKKQSIKNKIYKNFKKEYNNSKQYFKDKPLYEKLKLEGIKETPINIAVYCKKDSQKVLGATSQKNMQKYSVVCAIQNMWLVARALNIGIGWVSILKPKKVNEILNIPKDYKLIGYLCLGYTKEFYKTPELKKLKWKRKKLYKDVVQWV